MTQNNNPWLIENILSHMNYVAVQRVNNHDFTEAYFEHLADAIAYAQSKPTITHIIDAKFNEVWTRP